MSTKLHLIVHPFCPYAQRVLLVSSFKKLDPELTEVSLVNPPELLMTSNPLGEVPTCIISRNEQTYYLTESLNLSEYLDSFPGPSLYPKDENGNLDPLAKSLTDVFIKLKLGDFGRVLHQGIYPATVSENTQKEVESILKPIVESVEGGKFIGYKLYGKDEVGFADVMMVPFVERLAALHQAHEYLGKIDLGSLWEWYRRMCSFEWVQKHKISDERYLNLLRIRRTPEYRGLDLPLSRYDNS